jgi:hypothetical protein
MTQSTASTAAPSTFEQLFRLWLAGFGLTEDQCDKLCAKPRIALSLRQRDAGGLVQDLPDALSGLGEVDELRAALNSPGEKLMLMMALK